ncbi:TatD family hydrolase [Candidatus Woesearchaeota archaeon]|nr:TatD family hydrolase [Candidatus Woesearchaeota archaeon]
MLVDVHAHLPHPRYEEEELNRIIKDCKKNKVLIVSSGVNPTSNRKVLELSKKYPDVVKASLGVYPLDAIGYIEPEGARYSEPIKDLDSELEFIEKNKKNIISIGEIGLDRAYVKDKDKEQKEVFMKVLELAEKVKKPVVIHTRGAEKECIEILETTKLKKVDFHFFSGNLKLVKRIEDNGWYLSIPCPILRNQHFQLIAEKVNINQLLTETDSPYAPPRGEINNNPMNVKLILEKIAEIKKISYEETENNIFMNFQKVFM